MRDREATMKRAQIGDVAVKPFIGREGYRVVAVTGGVNLDGQATALAVYHVPLVTDVRLADAIQVRHRPSCDKARRDEIREILIRAGETLRRVQMPREVVNLGRVVKAVDVIRERSEHGAWDKDFKTVRRPTADELDEVDQALLWLLRLDRDHRKIVWGMMLGDSVRDIAKELAGNRSKSTVHRMLGDALGQIMSFKK